jgi:hypothetical protein
VKSIVQVINEAVRHADVRRLPCDRVNLDYERHEYRDSDEHRATDLFESPSPTSGAIGVPEITANIPSILRYFLDGSGRTYRIADLLVRGHYLPLIAGQVGVGVVLRESSEDSVKPIRDLCSFRNVKFIPRLPAGTRKAINAALCLLSGASVLQSRNILFF